MRLTNPIRQAFVKAAMDDVPKVDYTEQAASLMLKASIASMPPAVRKVYDSQETRHWLGTSNHCVKYTSPEYKSQQYQYFTVYGPLGNSKLNEAAEQASELLGKGAIQSQERSTLRKSLQGIANGVSTRKALLELLPEFEKYLPAEETKDSNLPAISNVVGDFIRAGWPKNKPPVKSIKPQAAAAP